MKLLEHDLAPSFYGGEQTIRTFTLDEAKDIARKAKIEYPKATFVLRWVVGDKYKIIVFGTGGRHEANPQHWRD